MNQSSEQTNEVIRIKEYVLPTLPMLNLAMNTTVKILKQSPWP